MLTSKKKKIRIHLESTPEADKTGFDILLRDYLDGTLKNNLEINGIGDGFEIHNQAFEDLSVEHADLCVIDAFPGQDISDIQEKAEKIADNVVII